MFSNIQKYVLLLLDFENQSVGPGDPGLKDLVAQALNLFGMQRRVKRVCQKKIKLLKGSILKGRGELFEARLKTFCGRELHRSVSWLNGL